MVTDTSAHEDTADCPLPRCGRLRSGKAFSGEHRSDTSATETVSRRPSTRAAEHGPPAEGYVRPSACNSCSLKLNCTDWDAGRLLERQWDAWVESELCWFHRGISLALLLLATVILLSETFRYSPSHDRVALVGLLIPLGLVQWKLIPSSGLRRQTLGS